MKLINRILLLTVVSLSIVANTEAQETMYIYKDGAIVGEHVLAEVDSVIFYKADAAEENTVTDIDGNVYNTVVIGTQTWMAENLKTTKYQNGDNISTSTPASLDVSGESEPKYQWVFSGDESNVENYGRLYTHYTVTDSRNVCPSGWHVPTDTEWQHLEVAVGMSQSDANSTGWRGNNEGNLLKTKSGWVYDGNGTNEYGFSAVPAGMKFSHGPFDYLGVSSGWWTSTTDGNRALYHYISYSDSNIFRGSNEEKHAGFSIRCIKD